MPIAFIGLGAVLFLRWTVAERQWITAQQRAMFVAVVSLWFFNLRQSNLLIWGMLSTWGVLIFVLVSLDLAVRRYVQSGRWPWLPAGLFVVGAACTGQGLAIAPYLVLLATAACATRHQRRRGLVAMAIFAVLFTGIYFRGVVHPSFNPPLTAALHHPLRALGWCILYAGSPFSPAYGGGLVLGSVLISAAVAAVAARAAARRWKAVWELVMEAPLLVISAILMLVVMIGRVGFGIEQAASSRYVPFSVLLVSSTVVFALDQLRAARPRWTPKTGQ